MFPVGARKAAFTRPYQSPSPPTTGLKCRVSHPSVVQAQKGQTLEGRVRRIHSGTFTRWEDLDERRDLEERPGRLNRSPASITRCRPRRSPAAALSVRFDSSTASTSSSYVLTKAASVVPLWHCPMLGFAQRKSGVLETGS